MIFSENIFQSDLFHELIPYKDAFLVTQMVNNLPAMRETQIQSLSWEDSLEKGMATQSSVLA